MSATQTVTTKTVKKTRTRKSVKDAYIDKARKKKKGKERCPTCGRPL